MYINLLNILQVHIKNNDFHTLQVYITKQIKSQTSATMNGFRHGTKRYTRTEANKVDFQFAQLQRFDIKICTDTCGAYD